MLNKVTLPLLGLFIAVFAGCAGSRSPSASVAPPADVNGTWAGGTATGTSSITMVLRQSGTSVKGTLTGAGPNLDGPIEGTVDGNTIRLREQFGETPLLNVRG